MTHLMVTNPFIRPDAARSAMRGIGQALQRRRGMDLAQQSPASHARWSSVTTHLWYLDHGVERALPADMKKPLKRVKGYFLWYKSLAIVKNTILAGFTALLLGGCSYDYLQHTDRVSYSAGNAVKANLEGQTTNPSSAAQYDLSGLGKNGQVTAPATAGSATTGSTTP